MSHPLAVYTAIYLAILFVTVSIWGGSIAQATGDARVLLFALGAFSLKLAIDDYVHFLGARRERLHIDLLLSLVIYLLLAGSIAHSAVGRVRVAALQFAAVFLVGAVWILYSGFSGSERRRRIGWLLVNGAAIALLVWAAVLEPQRAYTTATIPLPLVFFLVVADFFVFGTLRRLANVVDAPGRVDPEPVPEQTLAVSGAETAHHTAAPEAAVTPTVDANTKARKGGE